MVDSDKLPRGSIQTTHFTTRHWLGMKLLAPLRHPMPLAKETERRPGSYSYRMGIAELIALAAGGLQRSQK
jgi:hypothetical protein